MKVKTDKHVAIHKNAWVLTPVAGTLFFVILYIAAARLYPGGSQVDQHSIGFSWVNNYWCNLLNEKAINGLHNPAKPIAMAAMVILACTLSFFWFIFPGHINAGKISGFIIRSSGILAMGLALLLFTPIDHDLVTNLASFFGFIATIGTIAGLYKMKWRGLFVAGLINVLLIALNNYFYHTKGLIIYLPLIQKISFAFFLVWVCSIDIRLYRLTCSPKQDNKTTTVN